MKANRPSSRNRHIAPAIIGMGVSTIGNLVSGAIAQKKAKDQQQAMLNQYWNNVEMQDATTFENYNTGGQQGIDYFANGGELVAKNKASFVGKYNTKGGKLVPIADGVEEVVGNTHGENTIDGTYGVQLQENGEPVAEVEDGEVIADDKVVFSNRMMFDKNNSYADKMKQLSTKRAKLDGELEKAKIPRVRNTIERRLSKINMAEDVLYTKQEEAKLREGEQELGIMAKGGVIPSVGDLLEDDTFNNDLINKRGYANRFSPTSIRPASLSQTPSTATSQTFVNPEATTPGSILDTSAPLFLDNVANALINTQSPRVPTPRLNVAPELETRVNVAPQVAAVRDQVSSIEDNINRNTSNSNVARANIAANRLRGAETLSSIYAQKENTERGLRNQNASNRAQINAGNIATMNENAVANASNVAGNLRRVSSNFANIGDDLTRIQERRDLDRYYDEDLLNNLLDDKTGEKKRTVKKSPYMKNMVQKNPYLKSLLTD